MPTIKSPSNKARSQNIKREIQAGRPTKQAVAIAFNIQRQAQKKKPTKS